MPIVEIALLIQVGSAIGVLWTILLIFLTAIAGSMLLRVQGLGVLMRSRNALGSGRMPAKEVAEGVALAVGGALLLTPGFVTDAIGFFLLIPVTRGWLVSWASRRLSANMVDLGAAGGTAQQQPGAINAPLEGEFRREE